MLTLRDWPNWSPDGHRIVFERELSQNQLVDKQIFIHDIAASTETQLTSAVGVVTYNARPSWSPDGSAIAYTKYITSAVKCPALYVISLMVDRRRKTKSSIETTFPKFPVYRSVDKAR